MRYSSLNELKRVLAETGGEIVNLPDVVPARSKRERTEAEAALLKAQRERLQNRFADMWRQLAPDLELLPERTFHPTRGWRADFQIAGVSVLIEIEGGTRMKKGRHTTHGGYRDDCEKYNAASMAGFRLLRFTSDMIAVGYVESIIEWLRGEFDLPVPSD